MIKIQRFARPTDYLQTRCDVNAGENDSPKIRKVSRWREHLRPVWGGHFDDVQRINIVRTNVDSTADAQTRG